MGVVGVAGVAALPWVFGGRCEWSILNGSYDGQRVDQFVADQDVINELPAAAVDAAEVLETGVIARGSTAVACRPGLAGGN